MESQRIKSLTEGFLRGWLKFDYPLKSSHLREEIVLSYIQDERLYELLKNRLFIETSVRSSFASKSKEVLAPIFEVADLLIGLKLPSALPKDTINKDTKDFPKDDLAEWKKFLEQVNKK